MDVTDCGIVISVKNEHPMKHFLLISKIFGGISNCFNDLHLLKALCPIFLTEEGTFNCCNELQSINAPSPIS